MKTFSQLMEQIRRQLDPTKVAVANARERGRETRQRNRLANLYRLHMNQHLLATARQETKKRESDYNA